MGNITERAHRSSAYATRQGAVGAVSVQFGAEQAGPPNVGASIDWVTTVQVH